MKHDKVRAGNISPPPNPGLYQTASGGCFIGVAGAGSGVHTSAFTYHFPRPESRLLVVESHC